MSDIVPKEKHFNDQLRATEAPVGDQLAGAIDDLIQEHGAGLDRVRAVLAIRMNQYTDLSLNKKDVEGLARQFMNIELGSASNLVMICTKAKCVYRNICALFVANKCPEGYECIHENKVLTVALDHYITSLAVDLDNYPEMIMVNQLVEYELIEYRCNAILALDNQNLKMRSVIGIDAEGQVITKEEVSHALTIKLQVFKNKMQLLDAFTATRRETYKKQAALKEAKEGHAKTVSTMKAKLQELRSTTDE